MFQTGAKIYLSKKNILGLHVHVGAPKWKICMQMYTVFKHRMITDIENEISTVSPYRVHLQKMYMYSCLYL